MFFSPSLFERAGEQAQRNESLRGNVKDPRQVKSGMNDAPQQRIRGDGKIGVKTGKPDDGIAKQKENEPHGKDALPPSRQKRVKNVQNEIDILK